MWNYKLCSIHILWNIKMFWSFHWNDDLRFTLKRSHDKLWNSFNKKIHFNKDFRNKMQTYEIDPIIKDFVCNIFGWWWSCQNRIWYFQRGDKDVGDHFLNFKNPSPTFQSCYQYKQFPTFVIKQIACLGRLKE